MIAKSMISDNWICCLLIWIRSVAQCVPRIPHRHHSGHREARSGVFGDMVLKYLGPRKDDADASRQVFSCPASTGGTMSYLTKSNHAVGELTSADKGRRRAED